MMLTTTAHCHTTDGTNGLRQCQDKRCGAWTINGVNWSLDPTTLTSAEEPYPGAFGNEHRPVMPAMTKLEPVAA